MTLGDVGLGVAGVSVAADEVIDAECHALLWTRLRTIRLRTNGTAAAVATVSQVATAALTASTAARVLDVGVSAGDPSLLTPAPDHRSCTVGMFVGESCWPALSSVTVAVTMWRVWASSA